MKKCFKIETLRNVFRYIHINVTDFMWIHGKLNVPDMQYSWYGKTLQM